MYGARVGDLRYGLPYTPIVRMMDLCCLDINFYFFLWGKKSQVKNITSLISSLPMTRSVIPLESNPEIFNALSYKLGLSPVLQFHDVYSITDADMLAFLPQPIYAVIMLFPITEGYENHRHRQDAGKPDVYGNESFQDIKWFKQTIGNACGLYALLHILSNLPSDFIIKNLILKETFLSQLKSTSTTADVSKLVDNLEQNIQLDSNYGNQGQTEAPEADTTVNLHFITFVKGKDNHLYELDGRRKGPVDLGESVADNNILNDQKLIDEVQFFMNNTDEENRNNFALMAIGPSLD